MRITITNYFSVTKLRLSKASNITLYLLYNRNVFRIVSVVVI